MHIFYERNYWQLFPKNCNAHNTRAHNKDDGRIKCEKGSCCEMRGGRHANEPKEEHRYPYIALFVIRLLASQRVLYLIIVFWCGAFWRAGSLLRNSRMRALARRSHRQQIKPMPCNLQFAISYAFGKKDAHKNVDGWWRLEGGESDKRVEEEAAVHAERNL